MDLGQRQLEESLEHLVHRLGAQTLGQLGRVGDVAEQHGDLLSLALERVLGGEDLLGQMPGRVALRRREPRGIFLRRRARSERVAALLAELVARPVIGPAFRARDRQTRPALRTELGVGRDVVTTLTTLHTDSRPASRQGGLRLCRRHHRVNPLGGTGWVGPRRSPRAPRFRPPAVLESHLEGDPRRPT